MRRIVRLAFGGGGVIGMRRPKWWAVALTVVGVLIFVRLGVWQLDRAAYKEQLKHLFETAAAAPLVSFDTVRHGVSDKNYPHVEVHGHFLQDHEYMLDDKIHANRRGVEVYAPFRVAQSSRLLLVDLGFLPRAFNGELPQLPALRTGPIAIKGLYATPPRPGLKMGGNRLPDQKAWPKTTIYIDLAQIGQDLGRDMFPRVLLIDPNPHAAYVRQWEPDTMPPMRHRAYALQWFTFAVAAIVIFVVMNRKKPKKKNDEHD